MPNSIFQPGPEWLVEPLQADHLQAAIELECAAGLGPTTFTQMLEKLHSPTALLLAAFRNLNQIEVNVTGHGRSQHLIGLLTGWVVLDEVEIESLVVAEALRGQGVGRALLTAGLRLATQRGATKAYLEVREDNQPALKLYRSLGFAVVGRRKHYYREPLQDALLLSLDLQNH